MRGWWRWIETTPCLVLPMPGLTVVALRATLLHPDRDPGPAAGDAR